MSKAKIKSQELGCCSGLNSLNLLRRKHIVGVKSFKDILKSFKKPLFNCLSDLSYFSFLIYN